MQTFTLGMLDKIRRSCDPPTWYQVALKLDAHPSTIYRAVHKGGTLDNRAAFNVAAALGLRADLVVALMEADRSRTPEVRQHWERLAGSAGNGATIRRMSSPTAA